VARQALATLTQREEDSLILTRLSTAHGGTILALGALALLASCVGEGSVSFVSSDGSGGNTTSDASGNASGGSGVSSSAGGSDPGAGGSAGQGAGGEPAADASGRRDGPIAEKIPEDGGRRDAADDGAGIARDSGPGGVVFNFDLDSDFAFWDTLNDVDGVSTGGALVLVNDDAVPGHVPARALQWSVTFTNFQTGVRALAQFPQPMNWSGRKALHLTVKITSGAASLQSYQLYIQTGGPSFASRYLDEQPIGPIADNGTVFHDVSISLTNTTISASLAFFGLVLHPAPRASSSTSLPAPAPAIVEIDNIWLE